MPAPAGPSRRPWRRAIATLAALAATATPSMAQVPAPTDVPAPIVAAPDPALSPGHPATGEVLPPTPLEIVSQPLNPTPGVVSATPVDPPPSRWAKWKKKPLPGSLEEQIDRDYAAREALRCMYKDCTFSFLPTTLLWEPPLAKLNEPRMSVAPNNINNYKDSWSLDTSIGTTVGLVRLEPDGSDMSYQLDLFGVVQTRLTPEDVQYADYRFGFPLTFRRGPWAGKVGYEHTSAHLGDRVIMAGAAEPGTPIIYARDEIVFALGRTFWDCLRIYGDYAHAFSYVVRHSNGNRERFDFGFDYYDRRPTGILGTPFLAFNGEFRGDQGYNINSNVQFGWLWRNPEVRLGEFRVFGQYYNGRSPYGQIFLDRQNYWSIGMATDY